MSSTGLPIRNEMMIIPTVPITICDELMSADAEPASSLCCWSIRYVAGGRMPLPTTEAGSTASVNAQGDDCPTPKIRMPLSATTAKQTVTMAPRLNRAESLR